jgi:hypothetical protein
MGVFECHQASHSQKCELRCPRLLTSYIRDCWSAPLCMDVLSSCYVCKEAGNNSGLYPVQGQ